MCVNSKDRDGAKTTDTTARGKHFWSNSASLRARKRGRGRKSRNFTTSVHLFIDFLARSIRRTKNLTPREAETGARMVMAIRRTISDRNGWSFSLQSNVNVFNQWHPMDVKNWNAKRSKHRTFFKLLMLLPHAPDALTIKRFQHKRCKPIRHFRFSVFTFFAGCSSKLNSFQASKFIRVWAAKLS